VSVRCLKPVPHVLLLQAIKPGLQARLAAVQEAQHFAAHLAQHADSKPWPLLQLLRPDLLPAASQLSELQVQALAGKALALVSGDAPLALASMLRLIGAPPAVSVPPCTPVPVF